MDDDVLGGISLSTEREALSSGSAGGADVTSVHAQPATTPGMYPRRGRRHEDMLAPIEEQTNIPGRLKHLHAVLLHATDPRNDRETPHGALRHNAVDFAAAFDAGHGEEACEALFEAVLNFPHRTAVYAAIVGIGRHGGRGGRGHGSRAPISARGSGVVPQVLSQLSRRLAAALDAQHALHARLLLRFLASLSASGVVAPAAVLEQLQELTNAARALLASAAACAAESSEGAAQREATLRRRRAEFLLYAVLAALPWFANPRASQLATTGGASPDPQVRRAFAALMDAVRKGAAEAEAAAPPPVSSVTALHPDRAAALDAWLDASPERQASAGEFAPLARSQLQVLLEAVNGLLQAEEGNLLDDDDEEAGGRRGEEDEEDLMADEKGARSRSRSGSPAPRGRRSREASFDAAVEGGGLAGTKRRRAGSDEDGGGRRRSRGGAAAARPTMYCALAVPTIARPGDLDATAAALLGHGGAERAGRRPDGPPSEGHAREEEGAPGAGMMDLPPDHGPVDEAGRSLELRALGRSEGEEGAAAASAPASAAAAEAAGSAFLPPVYTPVALAVNEATGAVHVSFVGAWTKDRLTGTTAPAWAPLPSCVPLTPSAPPAGVPQSGVLGRCSGAGTAWAWPEASQSFLRPNVTLFGRGGLSSSAALLKALKLDSPASATTPLALWAVREVCHDVLLTFSPFHSETAETLLALPMGEALGYSPLHRGGDGGRGGRGGGGGRDPAAMYGPISSTPLAVEALLTQLLWVPAAPLSQTYISVVLLDMLALEAQGAGAGSRGAGLVGTTLGTASRVLWKYLPLLDEAATDRVLDWMAQHVSATKWTWLWNEWRGMVAAPGVGAADPSLRFLRSLLSRVFALVGPAHYEEVVKEVFPPEWSQAAAAEARAAGAEAPRIVLPPHPTTGVAASPFFPAAAATTLPVPPVADANAELEAPTAAALALAGSMASRIAANTPEDALASVLAIESERSPLFPAEVLEAEPGRAAAQAPLRLLILAHALLLHSFARCNKEQTYGVVAARYRNCLVTSTAADDTGAHVLLLAVDQVLGAARNASAAWALEDLVRAGVVTTAQVVAYHLTPAAGASLFTAGTSPALTPSFLVDRALDRHRWEAVEAALDLAEAVSHRCGVEVSLWRGARVYDVQEVEVDLAAGAAKESELVAAAKAANAALAEGVLVAVARTGALGATLMSLGDALASAGADAEEDAAAAREGARAAFSRLRSLARRFHYVLTALGQHSVQAAVDAAVNRLLEAAQEAGSPLSAIAAPALAAVHATLAPAVAGAYVPSVLVAVPPLLRDADAPAPTCL